MITGTPIAQETIVPSPFQANGLRYRPEEVDGLDRLARPDRSCRRRGSPQLVSVDGRLVGEEHRNRHGRGARDREQQRQAVTHQGVPVGLKQCDRQVDRPYDRERHGVGRIGAGDDQPSDQRQRDQAGPAGRRVARRRERPQQPRQIRETVDVQACARTPRRSRRRRGTPPPPPAPSATRGVLARARHSTPRAPNSTVTTCMSVVSRRHQCDMEQPEQPPDREVHACLRIDGRGEAAGDERRPRERVASAERVRHEGRGRDGRRLEVPGEGPALKHLMAEHQCREHHQEYDRRKRRQPRLRQPGLDFGSGSSLQTSERAREGTRRVWSQLDGLVVSHAAGFYQASAGTGRASRARESRPARSASCPPR